MKILRSRLMSFLRADRVMVLEDQGISAFDIHEALMRDSATYRRLMPGMT